MQLASVFNLEAAELFPFSVWFDKDISTWQLRSILAIIGCDKIFLLFQAEKQY